MFENLVLEGGGVKGLAYCGALKKLSEVGILQNIKRFAGASAGAITAFVLALGYNFESKPTIEEVIRGIDFKQLMDDSWFPVKNAYSVITHYGACNGTVVTTLLEKLVADKVGNKKYTFQQLWNDKQIELVVIGCNITRMREEHFSYKDTPNMPIVDAIRISMSIPIVFKPVVMNDDYYVDGGLVNNYPLYVFGDTPNTLGLKLLSAEEKPTNNIYEGRQKVDNVIKFVVACITTISVATEQAMIHAGTDYWKRTISINTNDISATDFDLSDESKEHLVAEGYSAADRFLAAQV